MVFGSQHQRPICTFDHEPGVAEEAI